MKRSRDVTAALLSALAFSVAGCSSSDTAAAGPTTPLKPSADPAARCVNAQNVVVDDKECDTNGNGNSNWYYGGAGFLLGQLASGGFNNGQQYRDSRRSTSGSGGSGTARGGIGSSAGSDGSASS